MKRTFLMTCISIIVLFCSMSCIRLKNHNTETSAKDNSAESSQAVDSAKKTDELRTGSATTTSQGLSQDLLTTEQKMFKEHKVLDQLKFAASLEKEIFKVVLPEDQQRLSQFEVLSYALEQFLNVKSGQLVGYECQKLNLIQNGYQKFSFKSLCLKEPKTLAEIVFQSGANHSFVVRFFTKEWQSVIGTSAQLVGGDRECVFKIENKTLDNLTCDHTVFNINQSSQDVSLQDIRIKTFEYSRNGQQEVRLVGGLYKDMIEIKKIKLTIPTIGKIKYEEKKLKIKDDFADMQKKLLGEKIEQQQPPTQPPPQQQESVKHENQGEVTVESPKTNDSEKTEHKANSEQVLDSSQTYEEKPTQNPNSGVIDSNSPTHER